LRFLLAISRGIDWISDHFGIAANWCVLLSALISCSESLIGFVVGSVRQLASNFPEFSGIWSLFVPLTGWHREFSNPMIDLELYMFAGMVLFGAAQTLRLNEHVRVDLFYGMVSERMRIWIDIIGTVLFLAPMCIIIIYYAWPWFVDAWNSGEATGNYNSLKRWPVRLIFVVGFSLVLLQGVSELIKRIEALIDNRKIHVDYEAPLQ
jgi:TRAP-type mannitol/chloroaromatic compound transport system permease small subunit